MGELHWYREGRVEAKGYSVGGRGNNVEREREDGGKEELVEGEGYRREREEGGKEELVEGEGQMWRGEIVEGEGYRREGEECGDEWIKYDVQSQGAGGE
ncbi:hypothetical protein Pcinc_043505 [Petrolisthes cinctipes]|uniref:Uncharacterized protein n=1 Tax=Petrolisthes cinctipes TaxID=88211 RepID=A0AAE1BFS2_PETCI|nr:hypothetical protein Pcinc_043505 [Petrolisthes cinctipes]